jgi:hypothetical protein
VKEGTSNVAEIMSHIITLFLYEISNCELQHIAFGLVVKMSFSSIYLFSRKLNGNFKKLRKQRGCNILVKVRLMKSCPT